MTETRNLSELTTLRMGGPAEVIEATSQAEVLAALREHPQARVLGGGSNVVVADAGLDEPVVLIRDTGWTVRHGQVIAQAGTVWDDFVAEALAAGFAGIEALAGIPGCVGATPVQNVGAYGQEVSATIAGMRVLDRSTGEVTTMPAAAAGFGYRHSVFKEQPDRWVVLAVAFDLPTATDGAPVGYSELASRLGVAVGETAPAAEVRQAVLELRRGKGMVLDPADPDTRSAGSFFTNPIVAAAPDGAPAWPMADGRVKTSAAWLIQRAGIERGFHLPGSAAAVSSKHTLALTNRGGATSDDLLALAAHIRDVVLGAFGIRLVPEPVLWGCRFD